MRIPGRRAAAPMALAALLALAAACGSGTDSETGATTVTHAETSTTAGLPATPPDGVAAALPSPAPAQHGDLRLPAFPEVVRYEGQADVRGQTAFRLVAGRVSEGVPFFAPTILVGSPGQRLTLTIVNETPVPHNFTLDAEHVNQDVPSQASATATVLFPTSGALAFYCKFHSSEGQGGELFVA